MGWIYILLVLVVYNTFADPTWDDIKNKVDAINPKDPAGEKSKSNAITTIEKLKKSDPKGKNTKGALKAIGNNIDGLMSGDDIKIAQSSLNIAASLAEFIPKAGPIISGMFSLTSSILGILSSEKPLDKRIEILIQKKELSDLKSNLAG
eukprot:408139_1